MAFAVPVDVRMSRTGSRQLGKVERSIAGVLCDANMAKFLKEKVHKTID